MPVKTRNVAISVLVLAYSMFGIVGFVSEILSPTPIMKVLSSGLIFFSYATIAILSKRMKFRELFMALVPFNVFNIIDSYADLGMTIIKYQGTWGELSRLFTEYFWLKWDAVEANQTVTKEMILEKLGEKGFIIAKGVSDAASTVNGTINFTGNLPYVSEAGKLIDSFPEWVKILAIIIMGIYLFLDMATYILSNLVLFFGGPLFIIAISMIIIQTRANFAYLYVAFIAWPPIAAVFDSFIRIYIFRAIFFRLLRRHPLIQSYADGSYL